MKNTFTLIIVLAAVVAGIIYLSGSDTIIEETTGETITLGPIGKRVPVEVGNDMQNFILVDYDNKIHKLSDYQGKPVILNFWASWCPFCIEEMPVFEKIYQEYKKEGLEMIAVNRGESKERSKEFTDKMKLSFHLLLNPADDVYKAYQFQAMPTTILITPEGKIEDIKFGPFTEEELREKVEILLDMSYQKTESPKSMLDEMEETKEDEEATKDNEKVPEKAAEDETSDSPEAAEKSLSDREISVTDGVKHSVPLKDILSGGPPMDGIPSIDNPEFTSVKEADSYLNDGGIGTAVSINGVNRFYPNQILVWHEIVNDKVDNQSILVSYLVRPAVISLL